MKRPRDTVGPSLRQLYHLAVEGCAQANRRASMLERVHQEETDEMHRELETLRAYRDETEAALRQLPLRVKKSWQDRLKFHLRDLGLLRHSTWRDLAE
jgi:hypothetical protein